MHVHLRPIHSALVLLHAARPRLPMTLRHLLFLVLAAGVSADANADIHAAINEGNFDAFKSALSAGADLNARAAQAGMQTPLMHAVLGGQDQMVEHLLGIDGVDVTVPEQDGYTPMHGAGFQGRAAIARMLVAHGVSATDVHKDGYQPIHRACWGREQRHADTVAALIEAGVDPGVKSESGMACADMTQNEATRAALRAATDAKKEL